MSHNQLNVAPSDSDDDVPMAVDIDADRFHSHSDLNTLEGQSNEANVPTEAIPVTIITGCLGAGGSLSLNS